MPRKARITVPGAIHHVMARGIEGRLIFLDDADRVFFLSLLEERIKKSGYLLYAWCLMDNHYHLLIRVNEMPLGVFMRGLNGKYAQHIRRKSATRGYLFQDRYKSIVSQDQNYIEQMVRYIHLNPVRAGICKTIRQLDTYRWCGHAVLIGNRSWAVQNTKDVLRHFAMEKSDAISRYRAFLKQGLETEPDLHSLLRRSNETSESIHQTGCWVIGNRDFVARSMAADALRRVRVARYALEKVTIEDVAREVCRRYKVTNEVMKKRGKQNAASEARKAFASECSRHYQFPMRAIACYLGTSPQAIANMLKRNEKTGMQ